MFLAYSKKRRVKNWISQWKSSTERKKISRSQFFLIINLLRHKAMLFLNHSSCFVAATSNYYKQEIRSYFPIHLYSILLDSMHRFADTLIPDRARSISTLKIKTIKVLARLLSLLISTKSGCDSKWKFRIYYSFCAGISLVSPASLMCDVPRSGPKTSI